MIKFLHFTINMPLWNLNSFVKFYCFLYYILERPFLIQKYKDTGIYFAIRKLHIWAHSGCDSVYKIYACSQTIQNLRISINRVVNLEVYGVGKTIWIACNVWIPQGIKVKKNKNTNWYLYRSLNVVWNDQFDASYSIFHIQNTLVEFIKYLL